MPCPRHRKAHGRTDTQRGGRAGEGLGMTSCAGRNRPQGGCLITHLYSRVWERVWAGQARGEMWYQQSCVKQEHRARPDCQNKGKVPSM